LHLIVVFDNFIFLDALIDPSEMNNLSVLFIDDISFTELFPYLLVHTVFSYHVVR
jgi:hypothetical protein